MTAARHARPSARVTIARIAARAVIAAAFAAAFAAGFLLMWHSPANVAPARPWHYPCVMHRAYGFESFTPRSLLMKGWCLQ